MPKPSKLYQCGPRYTVRPKLRDFGNVNSSSRLCLDETWRSGPVIILVQMSPFFCEQIQLRGPIQSTMKSHRQQISLSKHLRERENWKDMKALASILNWLSFFHPSHPFLFAPTPTLMFAQHPLIWGVWCPSLF